MKHVLLFVGALLAGAMGGSLTTFFVLAHERRHSEPIIRAERFELVDSAGQSISAWGVDNGGYVQLAFGPQGDPHSSSSDRSSAVLPRAAIGLQGVHGGPFLRFAGADGQLLVLLDLDDFERPSLIMSDGQGMGLSLGSERSDTPDIRDKDEHWALNFLPEDTARIGARTEQRGAATDVRGFVWIAPKPIPIRRIVK